MNKPTLSVVIPTHKNIFLYDVLKSLVNNYAYNPNNIEIIVVENPEVTEDTTSMITRLENEHGGKITLINSELGANKARNAGIRHSSGSIIGLLDDDCITDRSWQNAMISTHTLYPNVGVVGGCMKLLFCATKPRWLEGAFYSALALIDRGINVIDLSESHDKYSGMIVSGNMSFKRIIYDAVGGFDESMGYIGKDALMAYDENDFIFKCMQHGHPKRLYIGNAIVYHYIPESRTTIEHFMKKSFGDGFQFARLVLKDEANQHKKYEDFIIEFVLPYWNLLLTHSEITDIRSRISHEESTRIYLTNVLKCKIEFLNGFMQCLNQYNIKHHNTELHLLDHSYGL